MALYYINGMCEVNEDDEGVHVTQFSMISHKNNTMVFKGVRGADVAGWLAAKYMALNRPMVQDVFPTLTDPEREFLLTGITPEEWDAHFDCEEESSD